MAVHVIGHSMSSDQTDHQARSVGDGGWVVSFLPGRTLTAAQAVAALRGAEELAALREYAQDLSLTALELAGMAEAPCSWPTCPPTQAKSNARRWMRASR
ncbi:hypothetical protein GCM10009764_25180 [Nocardia ninae]|uniref:Uncharacterized protein n=1 Tax=Nocardia ninae NBRC 108245 TaxID=1210091 RepID=A0A511MC38_9NOCA|nr:hypothetical protein NN4_27530 [Nocardia ninae NBRC 108245]